MKYEQLMGSEDAVTEKKLRRYWMAMMDSVMIKLQNGEVEDCP